MATTGIGVVTGNHHTVETYAYTVVETDKTQTVASRLEKIYTRLDKLFHDEKPDLVVVEDIFSVPKFPQSGIVLGKVSGVVLLAGHLSGVPVIEIPVREAKQVLSGNGSASKAQLEKAVRHLVGCPEPIRPDHASDALGLALIGLFRYAVLHQQHGIKR
jgi:crossover junction endodeoxyribonuclease RuvC